MIFEDEKMAVPAQSVGADWEQPIYNTTNESITNYEEENNAEEEDFYEMCRRKMWLDDPNYLPTVSLNELYDNVYQSRLSIIDGLLYTGAYILAGAPKIGKSFLVAQIAYHVSTGKKLWDYDVKQGSVLYLALEDDYRRLQERMSRMFGIDATGDLFFSITANQIGKGLNDQLEGFIYEKKNTKLIIIDTLQKVREIESDTYSYAGDYEIISKLKEIADKHCVCILIVHHTRKQPSVDSFEMISGTTGLLGCADGAFLMQKEKRTDRTATLEIVGRDQPDQRLYLSKDQEHLIWNLEHKELELWKEPPDKMLEKIAGLLTQENPVWQGSATELVEILGEDIKPNFLSKKLNVKAGRLLDEFNIRYENNRTKTGSNITLTLTKG